MVALVAQRFRLLGEPIRLRILQAIEPGELPVGEIVERTGSTQPNVSKHLQALASGGLVARRRDGNRILYSIADPVIFDLCALVCRGVTGDAERQWQELSAVSPATAKPARNPRKKS
jgi:DNA-binding transcriptional ArsR family regulator